MHKNFKIKQRSVIFKFEFSDPARVTVKEEYLLFDMVSMITSIGGTMGLFRWTLLPGNLQHSTRAGPISVSANNETQPEEEETKILPARVSSQDCFR